MPFVDVEDRVVRSRDKFGLTIGNKGELAIYFMQGHPLCKAKKIKTRIGTGKDFGLLMLLESPNPTEGRAVNVNSNAKGWHVKYSTLSGAPKGKLRMLDIRHIDNEDGSVTLVLPWHKPELDFSNQNVRLKQPDAVHGKPTVTIQHAQPQKPGSGLSTTLKEAASFNLRRN